MLGTKTITILNRLYENGQEKWFTHEILNCAFVNQTNNFQSGTSSKTTQSTICRIPKDKNYRPYNEWAKNPNGFFTLNVGDIVIGQSISERNITNGIEVQKKYKNSFVIKTIKDNCIGHLDHYKVEG